MTGKFYTYAYLRRDKTPYYVGKGCKNRAFAPHGKIPVPPKERILFLKTGLSEKEAFRHEVYMIFLLGRKNLGVGILINLTDGGEGHSGYVKTEEQKEKIRRAHLGTRRSVETCKKISKAKTGKPLSQKHKESISNTLMGHKPSEETRLKRGKALKGKVRTKETRELLSIRAKQRSAKVCPHCKTLCLQPVNFNRWHGDNCKIIKIEPND